VANVSVNRGVLIGAVGVAAVSLLALAYVLGRESGSGSVPAPRTQIQRVVASVRDEAPAAPTPVAPVSPVAQRAEAQPASVPAAPGAAVQAPAPADGGRGEGTDASRTVVAAYFDAVDHIQPGAMTGDANAMANEMGAALANGDMSGLDKLIGQTEAAREKLAAVVPPAACAEYHRESLASLDDALGVVRALKTAMESPEPASQLAGVAARANALRARADVLQKEEQDLRQRYGLKR
jgi:type IV secretory pathway VirB10-like protein